ncbi:MAG: plasmid pRiA4b ORF-3 family protein [Actinobacteria bacterium]|nr:plasmid pRiA4b ORF-3 family protein [Actinomycetota bacterium]
MAAPITPWSLASYASSDAPGPDVQMLAHSAGATLTTPPSRRRPRRREPVTLQVRIDLTGTEPTVWRRLELTSDLLLDDVHGVIQAAFGWTDSHLHRFGCGPEYFSDETEYYLMPFELDEGEAGIPEEQVRLDELLVDEGDTMFYWYDFGDDWQHVLRLEAVLPRPASARRAVCTDGHRSGPAEDCGGVGGYELIAAVTDPAGVDPEAVAEFNQFCGDIDPHSFPTTPFDIDEINRALADFDITVDVSQLPGPLVDLLNAVPTPYHRRQLRGMIGTATQTPVLVGVDSVAATVRPYAWLIDRVGDDGIKLTAAGYVPPAHVEAAFAELDLADAWIGKGNREDLTVPVLHLRESAQRLGLLRKHRGQLSATARAKALRGDPAALWWHLAERMPPTSTDRCAQQAGLLYLIAVAAGGDDPDGFVAEMLEAIGWVTSAGTTITRSSAERAAWGVKDVMRRLRLVHRGRGLDRHERITPEAVSFARAAVRRWPA